jgi:ssDNA-binding Zn-finger/Zn-ribbon topoisomerase 1
MSGDGLITDKQYTGELGTCPECGNQTLAKYTRRFVFNKTGVECRTCGYQTEQTV